MAGLSGVRACQLNVLNAGSKILSLSIICRGDNFIFIRHLQEMLCGCLHC